MSGRQRVPPPARAVVPARPQYLENYRDHKAARQPPVLPGPVERARFRPGSAGWGLAPPRPGSALTSARDAWAPPPPGAFPARVREPRQPPLELGRSAFPGGTHEALASWSSRQHVRPSDASIRDGWAQRGCPTRDAARGEGWAGFRTRDDRGRRPRSAAPTTLGGRVGAGGPGAESETRARMDLGRTLPGRSAGGGGEGPPPGARGWSGAWAPGGALRRDWEERRRAAEEAQRQQGPPAPGGMAGRRSETAARFRPPPPGGWRGDRGANGRGRPRDPRLKPHGDGERQC